HSLTLCAIFSTISPAAGLQTKNVQCRLLSKSSTKHPFHILVKITFYTPAATIQLSSSCSMTRLRKLSKSGVFIHYLTPPLSITSLPKYYHTSVETSLQPCC